MRSLMDLPIPCNGCPSELMGMCMQITSPWSGAQPAGSPTVRALYQQPLFFYHFSLYNGYNGTTHETPALHI